MSTVDFKFENGIEVRDRLSGYKGIINARCEYINGCVRYSVVPKVDPKKPQEIHDGYWLDENSLVKISNGLNDNPVTKKRAGGPTTRAPRF